MRIVGFLIKLPKKKKNKYNNKFTFNIIYVKNAYEIQ